MGILVSFSGDPTGQVCWRGLVFVCRCMGDGRGMVDHLLELGPDHVSTIALAVVAPVRRAWTGGVRSHIRAVVDLRPDAVRQPGGGHSLVTP